MWRVRRPSSLPPFTPASAAKSLPTGCLSSSTIQIKTRDAEKNMPGFLPKAGRSSLTGKGHGRNPSVSHAGLIEPWFQAAGTNGRLVRGGAAAYPLEPDRFSPHPLVPSGHSCLFTRPLPSGLVPRVRFGFHSGRLRSIPPLHFPAPQGQTEAPRLYLDADRRRILAKPP